MRWLLKQVRGTGRKEKREVLGGNEYSKRRRQSRRRRNTDKYWKRAGISPALEDPSQIFGTAATKATIKSIYWCRRASAPFLFQETLGKVCVGKDL